MTPRLLIHRPGLVVPVPIDPDGILGPTKNEARGPRWRRSGPNRFVPSRVSTDEAQQRIVEALANAPEGSAVTGWAAFHWDRVPWFPPLEADGSRRPIPIALDDDRTATPCEGVIACHDWLFEGDVTQIDGLPVTVPERSLSFAVRRALSLDTAVGLIDMAFAANQTDPARFAAHVARLRWRPGVRLLRLALTLADQNSWSPMESVMRLAWTDAGHPRPLCNQPIFDTHGRHLFTPDLLDARAGVVGEYNGAVHDGVAPRRRDLEREDLCRELGLESVTMMSTDLRDRGPFVRRLRAAYQRAAERPRATPQWTIAQPSWWTDTSTVAKRRALEEPQRSIWLRRSA